MSRLFIIILTALAAGLGAGAALPGAGSPRSAAEIPPLIDFYDSVWIDSSDGLARTLDQVADELGQYDVIFFGEFHGHSGIHLAQMKVFRRLHERHPSMTLSLEQFERDTQAVVDDYLAGEIGEKALQEDGRAWDNYEQSYRPLVEYAKEHSLPVLAANAPKSIVICVGREGLDVLDNIPQPDRGWAAREMHVDEGPYMDKYRRFISRSASHRGGPADDEEDAAADPQQAERMASMVSRSFSAQVVRDDTMAESIAMHLEKNPGRKVLHLNGNFHSASHLGTVERLKLRMPDLKLVVITPVSVADSRAPQLSAEDAASGDFLLLVREVPEMFVSDERKLEFQRKVVRKRMQNKCQYIEAREYREEQS